MEDAADHPERPVHTHLDYGRPDDVPPLRNSEELPNPRPSATSGEVNVDEVNVEDLPDEDRTRKSA